MQLDAIKARIRASDCSISEGCNQSLNLVSREFSRVSTMGLSTGVFTRRNRLLSSQVFGGAHTTVEDLCQTQGITLSNALCEPCQPGHLVISPYSHLPYPTLSGRSHMGCSGGYDPKAALSPAQQPIYLSIRQRAVGIALLVGHGSEDCSIPQSGPRTREGECISGCCHTLA